MHGATTATFRESYRAIAEALPVGTGARVVLEVPTEADVLELDVPATVHLTWLPRRHGGTDLPRGVLLRAAVEAAATDLGGRSPGGDGDDLDPDEPVWEVPATVAAVVVAAVRPVLVTVPATTIDAGPVELSVMAPVVASAVAVTPVSAVFRLIAAATLADEVDRVRVALAALPVEQRRAILLATIAGRTSTEIAEAEGVPIPTAKHRIQSAVRKLRLAVRAEADT